LDWSIRVDLRGEFWMKAQHHVNDPLCVGSGPGKISRLSSLRGLSHWAM